MLKRIPASQLEVGMYLEEFCCSWMDHPFWRSGFILTDAEDIRRIRASNLREVWIDASKGIDIDPAKPSVSKPEASAWIDADLQTVVASDGPTANATHADDFQQAQALCAEAKRIVQLLFEEARLGKAISIPRAEALVRQILDSITQNPAAMTSLVRLKNTGDFTYMHSVAVCVLMVALARTLELDDDETALAGLAGLLHDLGKAAIPMELLHKPGKLTDEEFAIMRKHPAAGVLILQESVIAPSVLDVCQNHHARIDGSGYPLPHKGNEISLYSRMAAVCDVYDAISSGRPYKAAWDPAESMRKMAEWSPAHFDPVVFHAFVKSIGIYPIGSLVRLRSGHLGVVIGQSGPLLLKPRVKLFFSMRNNARITPSVIDLSEARCNDEIEAREDPAKWNFPDLPFLWSGLKPLTG